MFVLITPMRQAFPDETDHEGDPLDGPETDEADDVEPVPVFEPLYPEGVQIAINRDHVREIMPWSAAFPPAGAVLLQLADGDPWVVEGTVAQWAETLSQCREQITLAVEKGFADAFEKGFADAVERAKLVRDPSVIR